jgi:membrane carboxypeptidase/penicillin-binding protein PbpC
MGAIIIEHKMTKEQILRWYLSTVYMGNGEYGIQTQIEKWTNSIEVISRLRYPNVNSINVPRVTSYQSSIRERLHLAGIEISGYSSNQNLQHPNIQKYPLITERIKRELQSYCSGEINTLNQWMYDIPANICHTQDIQLRLTIDDNLMREAFMISRGILQGLSEKKVWNASILIVNPKDHTILAYIGNTNPSEKIDMITRRRSVGSVLKPIIYLLALRSGADAEDYLIDDKIPYETGVEGRYFVPENYNPKSYGPIRIREALGNSLNAATVSLTETLGLSRVYDFLRSSGVNLDHDIWYYGYGISLGTIETTMENIVTTYDKNLTNLTDPESWQIAEILKDPRNRSRTFGISSILGTSIPIPVKTGTSTDFRDNWTIGYSPDAIVWVWVGNSDGSPMWDISWVSGAWPIWHEITEYMIRNKLISWYNIPPPVWIKQIPICLDTSCLRRELSYSRKSESPRSRPIDGIYFESDFFGWVSQEVSERWKMQK